MRAPAKKSGRRIAPPAISARLTSHIALEARPDGSLAAAFIDPSYEGYSVGLGKFSAGAMDRAKALHTGLPLASFAAEGAPVDPEIDLLVRRLAQRGLLEYRLGQPGGDNDQVVIEPQIPDYWPRTPKLGNAETIVLSRFAYLRRRGHEMVLESPRAGALFRLCDPKLAAAIAMLSTPQQIGKFRRQEDPIPITKLRVGTLEEVHRATDNHPCQQQQGGAVTFQGDSNRGAPPLLRPHEGLPVQRLEAEK